MFYLCFIFLLFFTIQVSLWDALCLLVLLIEGRSLNNLHAYKRTGAALCICGCFNRPHLFSTQPFKAEILCVRGTHTHTHTRFISWRDLALMVTKQPSSCCHGNRTNKSLLYVCMPSWFPHLCLPEGHQRPLFSFGERNWQRCDKERENI